MLTRDTQNKLREFLQTLAEGELSVENFRQRLAQMEEFEPYTSFLRIEKTGRRVMSAACIEHMLRENNRVQVSVRDCQYLIKYFDVDGDSSLNYTEFMQMILPCDNLRLRSLASQREPRTRPVNGRLPPHVERMLCDFFEREINLHLDLERIKADLVARHDWNLRDVF